MSKLIKSVVDAQTGQRGFIITGNETFLEPYAAGTLEFGVTLSRLRQLLPDSTSSQTLNGISTLFERWRREVAEVVIQSRRQVPLGVDSVLRGASTAFTQAYIAELRYRLTREPALLSRSDALLGEARRQLEWAQSSSVQGTLRTRLLAVAAQLDLYERVRRGATNNPTAIQEAAQTLDNTLTQLALAAQVAEANVSRLVRVGAGKQLVDGIRSRTDALANRVSKTLTRNLATSDADARRTRWVAFAGPLLATLVSLVAILQAQQRLNRSVFKLVKVVKEVAEGQLERRLVLVTNDELHALAQDFNRMADRLNEREVQNAQLGQFSNTLQACVTTEEAYKVTERFAPQLFGTLSGTLYRINASRNLLDEVVNWGTAEHSSDMPKLYTPSDCWALRQGKRQSVDGTKKGIHCLHAPSPAPAQSLCLPLISQDETLGTLYLYSDDPKIVLTDASESFAVTVAEQLALALSNLQLRESLRQQAIRDPLTGLFNRRHLEETLELELHRTARRGEALSVVMFDIDHFKRYNDLFGHDAGDTVLQALSRMTQQHIRAGDVACRFGGEEFLLLQPGMSAENALVRTESLRDAATKLVLEHRGSALGNITLSLGIASYPMHARTGSDLIKRADEALYQAKRGGRNQTVLSTAPLESISTTDA